MLKRKRSVDACKENEHKNEATQPIGPQECSNSHATISTKNQGDVYSRVLLTKTQGRGSLAGWTACPLCNANQKKYALGRGISMHLQQVHTPWNPGKAELARRERIRRRVKGLVYKTFNKKKMNAETINDDVLSDIPGLDGGENQEMYKERLLKHFLGNVWNRDGNLLPIKYEPGIDEKQIWSNNVVDLARQLEEEYKAKSENPGKSEMFINAGLDRDGNKTDGYKDSLPSFIKAASDGNLDALQQIVKVACAKSKAGAAGGSISRLLDTKDRNSSMAEDWAAGNGHLDCLKYLMKLRKNTSTEHHKAIITSNCTKKRRKREGKTSLHYACRNGHLHVVQYLLELQVMAVDIASGDGTTPLHLACYGGHFEVIRYLIEDRKADIFKTNDWGCGIGHWVAMSIQSDHEKLIAILNYIKESRKVGPAKSFDIFGRTQKQGHSSVHKAAQKQNRKIIEWLMKVAKSGNWTEKQKIAAGAEDMGGNKPSTIWSQMGGSTEFSDRMKTECGW